MFNYLQCLCKHRGKLTLQLRHNGVLQLFRLVIAGKHRSLSYLLCFTKSASVVRFVNSRGGEPFWYCGSHELHEVAGGPQKFDF